MLDKTKVTNIKAVGTTGVEVRVSDGTVYTAESLVVASGAWTNEVSACERGKGRGCINYVHT